MAYPESKIIVWMVQAISIHIAQIEKTQEAILRTSIMGANR